jgi:hypothetical protein
MVVGTAANRTRGPDACCGRGDLRHAARYSARIGTMTRGFGDPLEERRSQRASWPVARYRLGEEPSDDLSAVTTPVERIAMMWTLAVTAWRMAGRPLPTYDRRNLPGKLFRAGAPRPSDDDA